MYTYFSCTQNNKSFTCVHCTCIILSKIAIFCELNFHKASCRHGTFHRINIYNNGKSAPKFSACLMMQFDSKTYLINLQPTTCTYIYLLTMCPDFIS